MRLPNRLHPPCQLPSYRIDARRSATMVGQTPIRSRISAPDGSGAPSTHHSSSSADSIRALGPSSLSEFTYRSQP